MSILSGPAAGLEMPAADARVSPAHLIPLLAAALRAGIAGDALFHGLGLVAEDMDTPGFMLARHEAHTIVRRVRRLLRAPELGLMLGMRARITERGAMALGLMAAPTLGDALALMREFPASAGDLLSVHAERGDGLCRLVAQPLPGTDDIAPFLTDLMFAGTVQMARQVTGLRYTPAAVELTRARPGNALAYEDHYGCPVRFGCRRDLLATDLVWLAEPLPMASAMAYRQSRAWLQRSLGRAEEGSALIRAVERAIVRALPGTPAPAALARSVHLSERSLRRALATQGQSLRRMLDATRKSRALELVSGTAQPIADIAQQSGFSDVRAFSRAFKRWTGMPPSAMRRAPDMADAAAGSIGR